MNKNLQAAWKIRNDLRAVGYNLQAEGDRFYAECSRLFNEGRKLRHSGDKLRGERLRAKGNRIGAKGNKCFDECNKICLKGDISWFSAVKAEYGDTKIKWTEKGCVVKGIEYPCVT